MARDLSIKVEVGNETPGVQLLRERGVTSLGVFLNPVCLSVYNGAELRGAVLFERNTGRSATVHIAGREGRPWLTKEVARFATNYAFVVLGVRRLYSSVAITNEAALKINRRFGFGLVSYLPDALAEGDAFLLSMPHDEAVFYDPRGWFSCSAVIDDRRERLTYVPTLGALFHSSGLLLMGQDNAIPLYHRPIDRTKSRSPRVVKIQLGLACNYDCSFCSQAGHRHASSTLDVEALLRRLENALLGPPEEIELWGGEPLVYWKVLRVLVFELRRLFPLSRLSIVTNGALLDEEKARFFVRHRVTVCLSHEGSAQKALRGENPLDSLKVRHACRLLHSQGLLEVSSLFSERETSPTGLVDAVSSSLGFRAPIVSIDVPRVYRGQEGRLSDRARSRLFASILSELSEGEDAPYIRFFERKIRSVQDSLEYHTLPAVTCAGSDPDVLTIAGDGDVLLCQNTGVDHYLGRLERLFSVQSEKGAYKLHDQCNECPAVASCLGSCIYLNGEEFEATCANAFALHMALVTIAVARSTGYIICRTDVLEKADGQQRLCSTS